MSTNKVRENRLRRLLSRRGYRLVKTRRRDPAARDYARFLIIDTTTNGVVAGAQPFAFSLTMDDVEAWLERNRLSHGRTCPF